MDDKLLAVLIGIVAGALGNWIATFWIKPIVLYRELRAKVYADFIFYAQVTRADDLSEDMKELYAERVLANRRSSADLHACLADLPWWYRKYLLIRGHHPDRAATQLIGFSNTTDYDAAAKSRNYIRRALGYKPDDA